MCGMSKAQFKSIVRNHVISVTFTSLNKIPCQNHTKVRKIQYLSCVLQPYFKSELFNHEEISLLFNMRADTIIGLKICFASAHCDDSQCKLNCNNEDSIKHAFQCHDIKKHMEKCKGSFSGMYGNVTLKELL